MAYIAVMGHGVVGSGVVEVLEKNSASIAKKAGQSIEIKRILDLREFDVPYKDKFTKDFNDIANDPELKVVVEVMGGIEPAYTFVKTCLQSGKSVVTSNKELVAEKGAELLKLAKEHNVNFFFEASVGGGIPIIRPLHMCLAANEIKEVAGILNGTTNFILTKMIQEQMPFQEALALAQKLGYAEKNPAADVEGQDACRKICILSSLAFGRHVYPREVHTEGITGLTLQDVDYAEDWGGVIKLIGRAKKMQDGRIFAMVSPAILSSSSQLAGVNDVFNGILVRGDSTGDVVFYGRGAGKLPTASAVMADVIEAVKATGTSKSLTWVESEGNVVADYLDAPVSMYFRCEGSTAKKGLAALLEGKSGVRMLSRKNQPESEFAFAADFASEREVQQFVEKLEQNGAKLLGRVRILDY